MNIAKRLEHAILADDVDPDVEGQKLVDWFEALPPCCQESVNMAFTYVGGWSLETLIERAKADKNRSYPDLFYK